MSDRMIKAVPPGYLAAEQEPTYTYLPVSDLPPLLAEAAEPWRFGPDGEQWVRIPTVAADGDTEPDADIYAELADIDGDDDLDYFDDDELDVDEFGEDGDDED
jgi:hypothetical protein